MPLVDIGGGIKQWVSDSPDAGDLSKTLGLIDLYQRMAGAVTDQQIKEADLIIKANTIKNIPRENEERDLKVSRDRFEFAKAQQEFSFGLINGAIDDLNSGKPVGAALKLGTLPGGGLQQNEDGSFRISYPSAGGTGTFNYDPNKINDPKQKREFSTTLRSEWNKTKDAFKDVDTNYRIMQQSALRKTRASDLAMIISIAKTLDPGSVVREGDIEVVKKTQNVPETLVNEFNRLTGSKSGILSDESRANFLNVGKDAYKSHVDVLRNQAKSLSGIGMRQGVSPKDFITEVGVDGLKITPDEFIPRKDDEKLIRGTDANAAPQEPAKISNTERFKSILRKKMEQ